MGAGGRRLPVPANTSAPHLAGGSAASSLDGILDSDEDGDDGEEEDIEEELGEIGFGEKSTNSPASQTNAREGGRAGSMAGRGEGENDAPGAQGQGEGEGGKDPLTRTQSAGGGRSFAMEGPPVASPMSFHGRRRSMRAMSVCGVCVRMCVCGCVCVGGS